VGGGKRQCAAAGWAKNVTQKRQQKGGEGGLRGNRGFRGFRGSFYYKFNNQIVIVFAFCILCFLHFPYFPNLYVLGI